MSFNKDNITLNFLSCTACTSVKFVMSEDVYKDNIMESGFTSFSLKIEDTAYDILSDVVSPVTDSVISSLNNGSTTLTVSGITATTLLSPWDYIQIDDGVGNMTIAQIYKVVSDTEIELNDSWVNPSIVTGTISKLNLEVIIDEDISDGMYTITLDFGITGLNETTELQIVDSQIFYCHADACLENAYLKLSSELCNTCDTDTYINDLMLLQSLVSGVKYAKCCPNKTSVNKIFELINRICTFNNCTTC